MKPADVLAAVARHRSVLESPPLQGLLHLWETDRELVFQLGALDLAGDAPSPIKGLVELIHDLREFVRHGFQTRSVSPTDVEVRSGRAVRRFSKADAELLVRVIRAIDTPDLGAIGRLKSTPVSAEEVVFRLGHVDEAFMNRLDDERKRRPLVLRVDPEDLSSLSGDPAYTSHSLTRCVPRVLASPTAVFQGIRRDGRLKGGYAFCGLPGLMVDNEGNRLPPPENKIFCVYVSPDLTIFDWDWIRANPDNPREPSDHAARFESPPLPLDRFPEVTLAGVEDVRPGGFQRNRPWRSQPGDCVFLYFSDEPAFADRENEDLTVFRRFEDERPTGFKIKNFDRIVGDVLAQKSGRVVRGTDVEVTVQIIEVRVEAFLASSMVRQTLKRGRPPQPLYLSLIDQCRTLREANVPVEELVPAGC